MKSSSISVGCPQPAGNGPFHDPAAAWLVAAVLLAAALANAGAFLATTSGLAARRFGRLMNIGGLLALLVLAAAAALGDFV